MWPFGMWPCGMWPCVMWPCVCELLSIGGESGAQGNTGLCFREIPEASPSHSSWYFPLPKWSTEFFNFSIKGINHYIISKSDILEINCSSIAFPDQGSTGSGFYSLGRKWEGKN